LSSRPIGNPTRDQVYILPRGYMLIVIHLAGK
jgi:hypothetical protein